MKLFVSGVKPLANTSFMETISNPYLIFAIAGGGTLLWQSSSITTAVLVGMVGGGLPLEAGMIGIIGANIGTTGTALLASITAGKAGLQLAVFHATFNVIGALVVLPFVGIIARYIKMVV